MNIAKLHLAAAAALVSTLVPATPCAAQTVADLYPEIATLLSSGGAIGDYFGRALAIEGDTMVVGVPGDDVGANSGQGSVRVFARSGATWLEQATLTASGGAVGDGFGSAVALSGDMLAVAAPFDDVGANNDQGSVRIFFRNGTTWSEVANLTATGGAAGDAFGSALATSGDTVVVGAVFDDVGAVSNQGSARVFVRDGGTFWTEAALLVASDGAANDRFGDEVAIAGSTIFVSATNDDVGANADQGSVRVFAPSGSTWIQQSTITASGGGAGDWFGNAVSVEGDTLVVGVRMDDVGPNVDQGSVRVFARSGSSWTEQATLTAGDSALGALFGGSVALEGDVLVVGASGAEVGVTLDQGAAYVFERSGSSWSQRARLLAADGAWQDYFGSVVEIEGDQIFVAIPNDDIGAILDPGSIRVFGNYRVFNDTANTGYTSLAAAVAGSSAGSRLIVCGAAFTEADGVVDASQKRFSYVAVEPISLSSTALMTVATNTVFERSPDVASAGLSVAGDLAAPPGGTVTFEQLAVTSGGQFLQRGSTVLVNQTLATTAGGVCYLQGAILAEGVTTAVGAQNRVAGDTDVFASYTNAGTTIVQRGVLYIYGSLVNTGTMTGEVDNGYLPPAAGDGYSIGGDYTVAADASLALPDPVWWLRVGGDLDIAINNSTRFAMSVATIELTGLGDAPAQSLEVFAQDLGAVDAGFTTGNFLLGALRVRTGATVELVDSHNNAPGKAPEAIYTNDLRVPAGATLVTNGYRIYTRAATIAGTVSNPADIVVVPGVPECPADIFVDGVVNATDLSAVLLAWGPCTGSCVADINGDNMVDAADLTALLLAWGPCGAN